MEIPDNEDLTNLARQQIVLYPEKFGVMGQYSMEMLNAMTAQDFASFGMDMILVRLTTSVMCGNTVSEKPQIELNLPKNQWQHMRYKLLGWADKTEHMLWNKMTWKNFWMRVPYALALLLWKWIYKRPVKYSIIKADIDFEQRVLYPEINVPAAAGRPVIYETISVNYPGEQPPYGSRLASDPSRFLDRHEIANAVYHDPNYTTAPISVPEVTLNWLARHGVNVDQLVKRDT